MGERKENKGLASLEDILNNESSETNDIQDKITNDDSAELNSDAKRIFEIPSEPNESDSSEMPNPLDTGEDGSNTKEDNSETEANTNNELINSIQGMEEVLNELEKPEENSNGIEYSNEPSNLGEVEYPANSINESDNYDNVEYPTEVNKVEKPSNNNQSKGAYFGFEQRILLFSILFIVPFVIGFFLIFKSLYVNNAEYINYTETSDLDYKVYLKENSFYDEQFLGKDMLYVASLIDHVDIDFLYNFSISEKLDLDLKYTIEGVLSITDGDGKKTYLTKTYELAPGEVVSMKDKQDHTINERIIIDYEHYNQIANSFKATYGVDTSSKLSVYLKVEKASNDSKIKDISNENNMLIEIPLSQRSVSISMDYNNINNNSSLTRKKSVSIGNILLLGIALLFIAVSIFSLVKLLKLFGLLSDSKTAHDRYVEKLMRQYDRLIVEHFTCPDLQKFNVIKIKDFNELLDMRDNLKTPILYYNVSKHQKSYFYIQNYKDLYLLIIKDVDLENKKK